MRAVHALELNEYVQVDKLFSISNEMTEKLIKMSVGFKQN